MKLISGGNQKPDGVQILKHHEYGDNRRFRRVYLPLTTVTGDGAVKVDHTFAEDVDLYGGGFKVISGTPHDADVVDFKVVAPGPPEAEVDTYLTGKPIQVLFEELSLLASDIAGDHTEIPAATILRLEFSRSGAAVPDNDFKMEIWYDLRRHI